MHVNSTDVIHGCNCCCLKELLHFLPTLCTHSSWSPEVKGLLAVEVKNEVINYNLLWADTAAGPQCHLTEHYQYWFLHFVRRPRSITSKYCGELFFILKDVIIRCCMVALMQTYSDVISVLPSYRDMSGEVGDVEQQVDLSNKHVESQVLWLVFFSCWDVIIVD